MSEYPDVYRPTADKSWAHVAAMERSHQWQVFRGTGRTERACKACNDNMDSGMRYCPGSGNTDHTKGDE